MTTCPDALSFATSQTPFPRRLRGDLPRHRRGRARAAPPWRRRRPARPSASPRRADGSSRAVSPTERLPPRRARNIRRANDRRRRRHGPRTLTPSASRARNAARETAIRAGWALPVRVSSSSGPSHISAESFSPSASSTSSKTARAPAGVGEVLAHADGLAALAGKDECVGHDPPGSSEQCCVQLRTRHAEVKTQASSRPRCSAS